ncbi:MAG: YceI family protein [Planctomycetota bacterium]
MTLLSRTFVIASISTCLLFVAAAAQQARSYVIDPVHSAVVFKIEWGGLSPFYGTFDSMSGSVQYAGTPESLVVEMTLPVASIDSANEQRDQHLKSADYFNAREFPEITFVSTGVTANDDGTHTLAGDLTLLGVTKPIEATIHSLKAGPRRGGDGVGGDITFTINRSEFGMTEGIEAGALGDEVTIMVGLQSVAQ